MSDGITDMMREQETMQKNEYVPYGEEWKNELMKMPKVVIINMYRNACLELEENKMLLRQAEDAADSYRDRSRDAEREIRHMGRGVNY